MPEIVRAQGSVEWYLARAGRVTASRAAGCLRLGIQSERAAWRDIMTTREVPMNGPMMWGKAHEQDARVAYEVETGLLVKPTGFWVADGDEWLGASPDGLIGDDGTVDFKCPGELPTALCVAYRIQCLVHLIVTKRAWCDYCAWTPGGGLFIERVYPKGLTGLRNKLRRWYLTHVVGNKEPAIRRRRRRRAKANA